MGLILVQHFPTSSWWRTVTWSLRRVRWHIRQEFLDLKCVSLSPVSWIFLKRCCLRCRSVTRARLCCLSQTEQPAVSLESKLDTFSFQIFHAHPLPSKDRPNFTYILSRKKISFSIITLSSWLSQCPRAQRPPSILTARRTELLCGGQITSSATGPGLRQGRTWPYR